MEQDLKVHIYTKTKQIITNTMLKDLSGNSLINTELRVTNLELTRSLDELLIVKMSHLQFYKEQCNQSETLSSKVTLSYQTLFSGSENRESVSLGFAHGYWTRVSSCHASEIEEHCKKKFESISNVTAQKDIYIMGNYPS